VFEELTDRITAVFRKLSGRGKLTHNNIRDALRDVRRALLESDVNYKVARHFVKSIEEEALGEKVIDSITPSQQFVKIVHYKLVELLGGEPAKFELQGGFPLSVMLVGLQGSGKTTVAGKLALLLKQRGHNPVLVAADVHRPAAPKQLAKLGEMLDVPTVMPEKNDTALQVTKRGFNFAKENGYDVALLDTAGRLQIDTEMMDEIKQLRKEFSPTKTVLVLDAMTGQEAVSVASQFEEALNVDGFVLTKLDGDARGGAALSIREVVGKPIFFVGTGEKLDRFEPFYPDRMANRILGMGDIVTLVEKAKKSYDEKEAKKLERKLRRQEFTLEDFLSQIKQIKEMGALDELLAMIPGMNKQLKGLTFDERELVHIEAIINSMTPKERRSMGIIDGSRRKRIAKGSGTSVQMVNKLLKDFKMMKKMMKNISKMPKIRGFPLR